MFLSIFNFMLAHVPRFLRPGVDWLLNGLRSITNYVSQRWNALGDMVNRWYQQVVFWGATVSEFAWRLHYFAIWLLQVWIPAFVAGVVNGAVSMLVDMVRTVRDFLMGVIAGVRQVLDAAVTWLSARLADLVRFTTEWIDRLVGTLANLIRALGHVLNGPGVLAEWLVSAMWASFQRFLYQNRDRVFSWLTRESVAFTRWVTRELEDIILRWL